MSAGDWKDLYQAAVDGNLSLVQYHISQKVNPNYQHPEILRTPLVASLVEGHQEIAHYLLAHGADPSLLIRPDEVLSCILNSGVAKVAHHSLRRALKHRHVIVSRFA